MVSFVATKLNQIQSAAGQHSALALIERIAAICASSALCLFVLAWAVDASDRSLLTPSSFDGLLSGGALHPLAAGLTVGHAMLALSILVANLVNRRYGLRFAHAHIALSGLLAVVWILLSRLGIPLQFAVNNMGALQSFEAILSLSLGLWIGAVVFDRTRGVEWWNAPALSALTATFVAVPCFHLLAGLPVETNWLQRLTGELAFGTTASFALLIPYALLRPIIRPVSGLGGY